MSSDSSPEATAPAPPCVASTQAPASGFGSFYQETLQPLQRYLAHVLKSRDEAQDIAHDAFVRTYETMRTQSVGKPRAFLFTVARRLALNYRTRRACRTIPTETSVLDSYPGHTPDVVSEVISRQESEAFDSAVLALPSACRQVLILRLKEGLSHAEIAQKLDIAPSTVANHLTRAFRLLKDHVHEELADR